MAELKKHISSRRGFRADLTKLLQSLAETLDNAHLSEDNIATLKDLHEHLQQKKELLSGLDAKILEATTDDDEIEAEILQTEEIHSSILTAKAKIMHRLTSIEGTPCRPGVHTSLPSTAVVTPSPPAVVVQEHVTRLPKLDLPQFTGNPLFR